MRILVLSAACLLATACHTPSVRIVSHINTPYTVPEDSAITRAVKDAYDCISFKTGARPAYDHIKNYFTREAQLINFRGDTAQVTNIGQFTDLYRNFIESNKVSLFSEEEVYGRTEQLSS